MKNTRSISIAKNRTLTLPPEMLGLLDTFGFQWDFTFDLNGNGPRIVGDPSLRDLANCPVCKAELNGDKFHCSSCGAKIN